MRTLKHIVIVVGLVVAGYLAYQHFSGPLPAEVVLFVADGCPPCDKAEELLDENGIDYVRYNINESEANFNLFRKKNGRKLPLAFVGGQRVDGYDETMLNIAINGLFEPAENDQEVVMFVSRGCGWCRKAAAYFEKHGIEYTEYDVSASADSRSQYESLEGRGTPLIFVGDVRIDGFNQKALGVALKQAGLL